MTRQQRRKPPRDEEAAAFKGLGQAVTIIRERHGMDREELAVKAEMTRAELEKVERGELDEWWGGLRMIAKAFDMPVPALMMEGEELAPGKGGEKWRQHAREAGSDSAVPGARSDAAEGGKRGVTGAAVVDWSPVASVTPAPFPVRPVRIPGFSCPAVKG